MTPSGGGEPVIPRGLAELRRASRQTLIRREIYDRVRHDRSRDYPHTRRSRMAVAWSNLQSAEMVVRHVLSDLDESEETGKPFRCPCAACVQFADGGTKADRDRIRRQRDDARRARLGLI